jgi:hypothetical protein
MVWLRRRGASVLALLAVAACANVWGFHDLAGGDGGLSNEGGGSSGGSGSSGSGSGSGSDAGATDADATDAGLCTCTPQPPAGWTLVVLSASGAPCTGAWSGQATTLHDGISAPTPTCGCNCGAPTGVACTVEMEQNCVVGTPTKLASGTCVSAPGGQGDFPGGPNGGVYGASDGSCAPQNTSNVPPVTWTSTLTACNATAPIGVGSCGSGDTCAPAVPAGFQLCATQAGEVACPFGTQRTEYTDANDTRACSTCTCGAPQAVQCGGPIVTYTSSDCSGTSVPLPSQNYGPCTTLFGGKSFEYQQAIVSGSCSPSGGVASGAATPSETVTLCCL